MRSDTIILEVKSAVLESPKTDYNLDKLVTGTLATKGFLEDINSGVSLENVPMNIVDTSISISSKVTKYGDSFKCIAPKWNIWSYCK